MLRDMLFPAFVVLPTIPVIAFQSLVVLWFGNTLLVKAVITSYLTSFPMTVNPLLRLRSVDPHHVALLPSFGAAPLGVLWRLRLPTASPLIAAGMRMATVRYLVVAVAMETPRTRGTTGGQTGSAHGRDGDGQA